MTTRGVLSAGDRQTAEAGAEMFRAGGNAVDAAVAAAFAAFICELPLCSPLGGGVCVLEHGSSAPVAFDLFARTPGLGLKTQTKKDFEAVTVRVGTTSQVFHVGRASVAVPLCLPGLIDLHARYGTLPLAEVLAPAIALGREGFTLSPAVARVAEILSGILTRTPESRALLVDAGGRRAHAGANLTNRELAETFEAIAKRPSFLRDLYAALVTEFGPDRGGLLTMEDVRLPPLTALEPVMVSHSGWRLATMPAPSTGGVLVALGLRLLEGARRAPFLSREHLLLVGRVQEALLRERDDTFADRCSDPSAVRALLSDERLHEARAKARSNVLGSTTQISAIDADGTAIALTLTNGEGSGHVLSGTGMMANNLLGEEDLHPRGFHRDPAGTPIMTMMAPTILSRGADRIALGSGGSNRLRTAILQVLVGLVEHEVGPAQAVAAPRLHLELDRASGLPRVAFEAKGLTEDTSRALCTQYPIDTARFDELNLYFGGVHLAMLRDGFLDGVGDPRRGGHRILV